MPTCDAPTLAELSKCLCGLTPKQTELAKTYLLAVAAGVDPSASNLAELSKCLCGLNPKQHQQAQTYLLCQIANAEPPPPGETDGLIWGPSPETVDSLNGQTDAVTTFLNSLTNGTDYTTLSFGNPTNVDVDVDFSSSALLTSLTFRLLETVGGSVNVSGGAALESFSVPLLTSTGADFNAQSNPVLTSVSAPLLASVGNDLLLDATGIINATFPSLVTVTNLINISGGVVEVLSLPVLSAYPVAGITADSSLLTLNLAACVDDGAGQLDLDLANMTGLVTLNMAGLLSVAQLTLNPPSLTSINLDSLQTSAAHLEITLAAVTSISLPSLTGTGTELNLFSLPNCASISLPVYVTCPGQTVINNNPVLTSFSAPVWVPTDGTTIDFQICALDIPSVELILRRLVLAGVVACTIDLSGGTNAGTASLSAQGQADVATLGAQLTINP